MARNLNEVTGTPEELLKTCVARWVDRAVDWNAFPDAGKEGYRRSQHRYVGGGGSGKHDDPNVIPPGHFNISVMTIPPGQGTSSHTHTLDEAFFVLQGNLTAFLEAEDGGRTETVLGQWDCICRPAGVFGGIYNHTLEPAYVQVILPAGDTVPTANRPHGKSAATMSGRPGEGRTEGQ